MTKNLLKICMKKGFLLDREMLEIFNSINEKKATEIIEIISSLGLKERVVTKKIFNENLGKIQNAMVSFFGGDEVDNFFSSFSSNPLDSNGKSLKENQNEENMKIKGPKIKLINSPAFPQRKVTVKDFVKHFRSRYEILKNILEKMNLDNLTTIRKITKDNNNYTIIGCVLEKRITKNKNLMLTVEDLTGSSTVLINQQKKDLFFKAKDIMLDDVLAFEVNGSSDLLFCNNIMYPEAYLHNKKKSDQDTWIVFTSDLHCGSQNFLEKNFLKFIKWINGEDGNENIKEIAKKVKYLFLAGDLIDGVNHYPGQEKDLNIHSSSEQYRKVAEMLKLIRKDIQIIIGPGNHDAVWVGEPQPIIGDKWAPELYDMENVHMVPSPALIEIDGDFKILMYHGASINAFIDEIPEIRSKYGHSSPALVVKEMVKRRHLAPMHGLVDYIPCESDPMIINPVPDIILTGDQHILDIQTMNNILLIASSCWQSVTPFMEKVGITPDPCKVPLFNLKSRELKILDFSTDESIKNEEENLPSNLISNEVKNE